VCLDLQSHFRIIVWVDCRSWLIVRDRASRPHRISAFSTIPFIDISFSH
jgi:hypothetical protein